jgi:ABC-2 type transport system permease protein
MVAYVVSGKLIIRGLVFSSESRRRKISRSVIYNIFEKLLYPVGKKISVIVTKDIKTFLRDPTQYVQFAIFLGLLALYFFNLRSFAYEKGDLSWRILVAQLNLFATALTLSTFTCRFVYPQLSIEGQRFWIMGMAPIARQKILISKFVLALVVTTITGEVLIVVSSYMLKTPPILFLLHIITVFSICFGLSGISVGLGAIYPNFKEANPAKIISGFGGTLNLVLNLGFVVLVITLQFVPCFLYFWRHNIQHETFRLWIIVALFGIVFLSASFALLTLLFGIRAIKRLEI